MYLCRRAISMSESHICIGENIKLRGDILRGKLRGGGTSAARGPDEQSSSNAVREGAKKDLGELV